LGSAAVSALPAGYAATLATPPALTKIALAGELATLGTDVSNIASASQTIRNAVVNDLSASSASGSINVMHPPLPPPSPPPAPSSPPSPPEVPPGSPSNPPVWWYTPYGVEAGCDPDCVGGCRRSLWSNIYTWHGQGLNLGLPEDDSFGWPGWKSNVTIKRCRTVVLDVDINVQLYSLVVWGKLEIQNRDTALVTLRQTCINVRSLVATVHIYICCVPAHPGPSVSRCHVRRSSVPTQVCLAAAAKSPRARRCSRSWASSSS
jgi:hypothetical protein